MAETAVWCEGLAKRYGSTTAVDGVELDVPAGTVLGFLGPNGAGKTTVIRILSTVLEPDAGSFAVAGVAGDDPTGIRQRIGVLPESAGYPKHLTGLEWLCYHGQLFGWSSAEARTAAQTWLSEVGVGARGSSLIGSYSRGMRQRLGIARALIHDPRVLFLDEPTLGLDPAGQRQILDLVSRITQQRRVTVVFSSHLLAEVEDVCENVVILNRGRIVAHGTVADVVRLAAAPRTAVVQVPAGLADKAVAVLEAVGVTVAQPSDRRAGSLVVSTGSGDPSDSLAGQVLSALVEGDVPVERFEIEGGRLSDAFLALTASS